MLQTLQTIGAILGIVAFFWKVWDLFQSYLVIKLTVAKDERGNFTAQMSVENRSLQSKAVDNALLLICPEDTSPIDAYNEILAELGKNGRIRSTRGIAVNVMEKRFYTKSGNALIPLPFFYSDQGKLGDECRTYRVPIDVDKLTAGARYSVYFLLWATGRLHRVTHDLFVVPKTSQALLDDHTI